MPGDHLKARVYKVRMGSPGEILEVLNPPLTARKRPALITSVAGAARSSIWSRAFTVTGKPSS